MPIGRVSHIDCSGLDITTVSSLLFFSLRIAYSLQGLLLAQWGQRKISDILLILLCYLYSGKHIAMAAALDKATICQSCDLYNFDNRDLYIHYS